MKNIPLSLLATMALSACAPAIPHATDQESLLNNPLFLELYAEHMVDTMVNLEIENDPLLQDSARKKTVDDTKEYWFAKSKEAVAMQRDEGSKGMLIAMKEDVEGEVLYRKGIVHFNQTFLSTPGPDLHVYISTVIDPRNGEFPDETAIDFGRIVMPYGAQSHATDQEITDPKRYRTIVLWDNALGRLYGFAQISPLY